MAADGRFCLGTAREPQALAAASVVHWWVLPGIAMGLAFLGDGGQRAGVLLFRDLLPSHTWRRLQVALRHGSLSQLASGDSR